MDIKIDLNEPLTKEEFKRHAEVLKEEGNSLIGSMGKVLHAENIPEPSRYLGVLTKDEKYVHILEKAFYNVKVCKDIPSIAVSVFSNSPKEYTKHFKEKKDE